MKTESEMIYKPAGNSFSAMVQNRCPHCRVGRVFPYGAYSTRFYKMNEECPVCNADFTIEPGFFYGSMYISYGITMIVEIALFIILYNFFNDPKIWVYIVALAVTLLPLSPWVFRISRMIMLTWFSPIKFDPNAAHNAFLER